MCGGVWIEMSEYGVRIIYIPTLCSSRLVHGLKYSSKNGWKTCFLVTPIVSCKPQLRLSDAVKVLKGNTARWLFLSRPEIKKSLWGGHLPNELERKIYVESMIHRTKDNPIVLYDFDDRFYQCMYMLHYA